MDCFICEEELDGACVVEKSIHDEPIHVDCAHLVQDAKRRVNRLRLIPLSYPAWFIARIMHLDIYEHELDHLMYEWVAYLDNNGASTEGSFWGCHAKEEMEKYILDSQENDGSGWYLSYVFHKGRRVHFGLENKVKWGQYDS